MGSIRFILFAILIWLVWRSISSFIKEQKAKVKEQKKETPSNKQKMVKCEYCSTHLPQTEAFFSKDYWFCNQQHQQLFLEDKR